MEDQYWERGWKREEGRVDDDDDDYDGGGAIIGSFLALD